MKFINTNPSDLEPGDLIRATANFRPKHPEHASVLYAYVRYVDGEGLTSVTLPDDSVLDLARDAWDFERWLSLPQDGQSVVMIEPIPDVDSPKKPRDPRAYRMFAQRPTVTSRATEEQWNMFGPDGRSVFSTIELVEFLAERTWTVLRPATR